MRVGLGGIAGDLELVKRADELGFYHLLVPEHPVIPLQLSSRFRGNEEGVAPPSYSAMPDPFILLARASAVTQNIKLGTGICLVPERNPLLLAKEIATLDRLSGGRFILGAGAGWLKEESEVFGVDFPRRWSQTREAIDVLKQCWTTEVTEHHGRYYDFPALYCSPKPLQQPHPPVLLGSVHPRVLERVVDWGMDGWLPSTVTMSFDAIIKARGTLNELAERAGRDPRSIDIMVLGYGEVSLKDPAMLEQLEQAGIDWVSVRLDAEAEGGHALEALEALADRLDLTPVPLSTPAG